MNTTITLTLKKKWFDMILSGEKKEEYREIKPYWERRFLKDQWTIGTNYFKKITFVNGYQKNAPRFTIECKGIIIGEAVPEWSDNWKGEVFVLKLGEIIKN